MHIFLRHVIFQVVHNGVQFFIIPFIILTVVFAQLPLVSTLEWSILAFVVGVKLLARASSSGAHIRSTS
jgi:hypothetical protein